MKTIRTKTMARGAAAGVRDDEAVRGDVFIDPDPADILRRLAESTRLRAWSRFLERQGALSVSRCRRPGASTPPTSR